MLFTADTPVYEVTLLDWDSSFFGRKIGKLSVSPQNLRSLNSVLENARRQQYDLIYAYCDAGLTFSQEVLRTYNGCLVDHKIIYEQSQGQEFNAPKLLIQNFNLDDDRVALYQLAYQSGEYSRYRIDHNFVEEDFKRLYRQWTDNSISGKLADNVFIHKTGQLITGFITIRKSGNTGTIGLLATDTHHRGQGIGTALLNHVKKDLLNAGLNRLEVVTQAGNVPACRFYEKNQFTIKSASDVYHLWL